MSLYELKIEIPFTAAEAAESALLEFGAANWSVLENVVTKQAWLVGVDDNDSQLWAECKELRPLLQSFQVSRIGEA